MVDRICLVVRKVGTSEFPSFIQNSPGSDRGSLKHFSLIFLSSPLSVTTLPSHVGRRGLIGFVADVDWVDSMITLRRNKSSVHMRFCCAHGSFNPFDCFNQDTRSPMNFPTELVLYVSASGIR